MMYNLEYFKASASICGDDFKNKPQHILINLDYCVSVSEISRFQLPFSGTLVGECSIVSMSNGDRYAITRTSYNNLMNTMNNRPSN